MRKTGFIVVYKDGSPVRKVSVPLEGECWKIIINNIILVLENMKSPETEFSINMSKTIFTECFGYKLRAIEELMSLTRYDHINQLNVNDVSLNGENIIRLVSTRRQRI